MSALGYELNDEQRIDMIRAAHERYKRRLKAGVSGVFEANASDTSRAGFDVKLASEILSPGEWPGEIDLNHLEVDAEGCE
jgi:hypothetical protein